MQLSPLNYFNMLARSSAQAVLERPTEKVRRRVETVVRYRCPECGELHEWEEDAEECCAKAVASTDAAAGPVCPVCGEEYSNHRDAADCCLWKDIDAHTRWQIADAVEEGSEWAIELGLALNAQA